MNQQTEQQKGPGHKAGIVAGILSLVILNISGKGDVLVNTFITGFVVGGGAYMIVGLLVDVIFGTKR